MTIKAIITNTILPIAIAAAAFATVVTFASYCHATPLVAGPAAEAAAAGIGLGFGGTGGVATTNPTTTSQSQTKNDSTNIAGALGQAPGAMVGCGGEVRVGWGLTQVPTTIPGVCAQLLAAEAIRSGDPTARAKGLEIMNRFALEYFGDDSAPTLGSDAAFRQ